VKPKSSKTARTPRFDKHLVDPKTGNSLRKLTRAEKRSRKRALRLLRNLGV